ARKRLFCSGANWYGDGDNAKKPSEFFEELAAWGEATGDAAVDCGPEPGDEHPAKGHRERLVKDWPGPARPSDADDLFPDGWRSAALAGSAPAVAVASLPAPDRAEYESDSGELRLLAAHLLEAERPADPAPWMPSTVAVSGIVDYARCPKRFYWSYVRPLPRFSGPAARIGTEIHRWIERRSSGQTTLIDLDEPPDLTPAQLTGEPGRSARLRQAFMDSRFAGKVPLFAERAFLLQVGDHVLRGRIDAIYGEPDGPWEVVDYKTGGRPDPGDPLTRLQLDVYALACTTVWGKRPEDLRL